ncbi:type II toxin-antitoxin system HicB family antitoxin [Prosthecodimorpha hirschii]|uniref:type II toxin-antitoxin system HicB family antitoxin n=1 Tax=Prosthecodimorpha hirschii TaxID=665126 RepID=UPI003744AC14
MPFMGRRQCQGATMRTFSYEAILEPGEASDVVVVSFPDVPEAITEGDDEHAALLSAEEALGLALLTYPARGLALPAARTVGQGPIVTVAADVAAKLAVLEAFSAAGISKADLAERLGKDEKAVRRILDPMHPTKLPALSEALAAMGQRLVIGVEPIVRAA